MSTPFQAWNNPDPQTVTGLNSQMVYGENIQFAAGLNHQIALGSNLQLCINPVALMDLLDMPQSAALVGLLGSGVGGNNQLTIGTSTNIIWGRQFELFMGPQKFTIDGTKDRIVSKVFLCLIGAACIAYPIAFNAIKDEDGRAKLVIGFQVFIDLCLAAMIIAEMYVDNADKTVTGVEKKLFNAATGDDAGKPWDLGQWITYLALLPATILPQVAIAGEEGKFNDEKSS
jgi:hypothetical protein